MASNDKSLLRSFVDQLESDLYEEIENEVRSIEKDISNETCNRGSPSSTWIDLTADSADECEKTGVLQGRINEVDNEPGLISDCQETCEKQSLSIPYPVKNEFVLKYEEIKEYITLCDMEDLSDSDYAPVEENCHHPTATSPTLYSECSVDLNNITANDDTSPLSSDCEREDSFSASDEIEDDIKTTSTSNDIPVPVTSIEEATDFDPAENKIFSFTNTCSISMKEEISVEHCSNKVPDIAAGVAPSKSVCENNADSLSEFAQRVKRLAEKACKHCCNQCHRWFLSRNVFNEHMKIHRLELTSVSSTKRLVKESDSDSKEENDDTDSYAVSSKKTCKQNQHKTLNQKKFSKYSQEKLRKIKSKHRKIKKGLSREKKKSKSFKVCGICSKTFHSSRLLEHMRVHSNERPFHCDDCNARYKTKTALREHVRIVHTLERPYECKKCEDRRFPTYSQLANHNRRFHLGLRDEYESKRKPATCEICNKTYSRRNSLNIHMRRAHYGANPHHCDLCDKEFHRSDLLMQHMVSIHKEREGVGKIFECHICHSVFKCHSNFKQHLNMHTGIKKYPCENCDNGFTRKSSLENHLKTCK